MPFQIREPNMERKYVWLETKDLIDEEPNGKTNNKL